MAKIRVSLFMCFLLIFAESRLASAQVRIVQWTDVHSTLETLPRQVKAIDFVGREFLNEHPGGEFIIYVIGDYTSLNPYSQLDEGQLSMEALKLFRSLGYTVLFTPGNHDALDWSGKIDGIELFIQQLKQLQLWGIPILASNFKKVKDPLKTLLTESYPLKTLDKKTSVVGMTLENLFEKSNLNERGAEKIFKGVNSYERALKKLVPHLQNQGVEQLVIGAHEGYQRLDRLIDQFSDLALGRSSMAVPLLLAADDHLVAAYRKKDTMISDAGSHGSFSVIDFNKAGDISSVIEHVAISEESLSHLQPAIFTAGQSRVNSATEEMTAADLATGTYAREVTTFIKAANKSLQRPLANIFPFATHKRHMKLGRTHLGSLIAQSLSSWVRHLFPAQPLNEPIIAFMNSSSYRTEEGLAGGALNEFSVRSMYPFLNISAVYRLKGHEIESLFFSLRKHYARNNPSYYSPQLDLFTKEHEGRLQIYFQGQWQFIKKKSSYLVVLDGWLAEHRFGQSFRIKQWIKILQNNRPIALKSFQDILVEHLPQLLSENPESKDDFLPKEDPLLLSKKKKCMDIFSL